MEYSLMEYILMEYIPGSSVHGILQARILEWVTISFSRGSSWPRDWTRISCIAGSLLYCRQILYQLSQEGSPILRQLRTIRVPYKLHNQMDALKCRLHGLILVLGEVLCICNKERQCGRKIKCSDSRGKLLGFQIPVASIINSWTLKITNLSGPWFSYLWNQLGTVLVQAWVGKEFPDMRQNEREIKCIRVGDC